MIPECINRNNLILVLFHFHSFDSVSLVLLFSDGLFIFVQLRIIHHFSLFFFFSSFCSCVHWCGIRKTLCFFPYIFSHLILCAAICFWYATAFDDIQIVCTFSNVPMCWSIYFLLIVVVAVLLAWMETFLACFSFFFFSSGNKLQTGVHTYPTVKRGEVEAYIIRCRRTKTIKSCVHECERECTEIKINKSFE